MENGKSKKNPEGMVMNEELLMRVLIGKRKKEFIKDFFGLTQTTVIEGLEIIFSLSAEILLHIKDVKERERLFLTLFTTAYQATFEVENIDDVMRLLQKRGIDTEKLKTDMGSAFEALAKSFDEERKKINEEKGQNG